MYTTLFLTFLVITFYYAFHYSKKDISPYFARLYEILKEKSLPVAGKTSAVHPGYSRGKYAYQISGGLSDDDYFYAYDLLNDNSDISVEVRSSQQSTLRLVSTFEKGRSESQAVVKANHENQVSSTSSFGGAVLMASAGHNPFLGARQIEIREIAGLIRLSRWFDSTKEQRRRSADVGNNLVNLYATFTYDQCYARSNAMLLDTFRPFLGRSFGDKAFGDIFEAFLLDNRDRATDIMFSIFKAQKIPLRED